MHRRVRALENRCRVAQERESHVLEGARVLTAACRESRTAVLAALDSLLRLLEPALDAVMVFEPAGEELACVYAAGARVEHFGAMRVRRDHGASLPARAALCGHRIELTGKVSPLIPTDRAALAIPMMIGASGLTAVVYAASAREPIASADALVRAVAQAAAPYALAVEREADRAQAVYDALTGLHTPRAFRTALQREIATARLTGTASIALWFVDTDHFKRVNDTLGHAAGDAVLQQMARLLQAHAPSPADLAARNGGDEFCAILRNTGKVAAIERARRFCDAVRAAGFGAGVRITASVGVAAYPYDASEAAELLELADAAMYHSKRCGRDRVSFAVDRSSFAVYG